MKQYVGEGYSIYKHTNRINGKVYIGLTKAKDLTRRWAGGHNYKQCHYFFSAIVRYGWLNFDHEILETGLAKEEAAEKEKYYIAKFRARNPRYGYNIQKGGFVEKEMSQRGYKKAIKNFAKGTTGCAVAIFDADGKRVKDFQSMQSAAKFVGCGVPNISRQCKRGTGTCRGYIIRYAVEVDGVFQLPDEEIFQPHEQVGLRTPIAVYDLSGNFISDFSSIGEAASFANAPRVSVSSCLSPSNHQKSANGYMFSKKVNGVFPSKIAPYSRVYSRPKNAKGVCQYDRFTGNLIAKYSSIAEAASQLGCTATAISRCLCGKCITSSNYIWKYESDGFDRVDPA